MSEGNRLDPVVGQQITPHLKLNEEFVIEDSEGHEKLYRIVESKELDKKTFRPLAIIKPVKGK